MLAGKISTMRKIPCPLVSGGGRRYPLRNSGIRNAVSHAGKTADFLLFRTHYDSRNDLYCVSYCHSLQTFVQTEQEAKRTGNERERFHLVKKIKKFIKKSD